MLGAEKIEFVLWILNLKTSFFDIVVLLAPYFSIILNHWVSNIEFSKEQISQLTPLFGESIDRIGVNNLSANLLIVCLKYDGDNNWDCVINPGVKYRDLVTTWKNFDMRMTTLSKNHEVEMILKFNTRFDKTDMLNGYKGTDLSI